MGVIDDAIALEERAESNYKSAAETTTDPGAAKVLRLLADEEAQHADALRTAKLTDLPVPSPLLNAAQDWIGGAIEGGVGAISSDATLRQALQAAMTIEQETEAFYKAQAAASEDEVLSQLFTTLGELEKWHYLLVSSLVTYFDRPTEWVESAEFGLREEY